MNSSHKYFTFLLTLLMPLALLAQDFNKNYIGINTTNTKDWDHVFLFADAIKQSRLWEYPAGGGSLAAAQVDANGWPLVDAELIVAVQYDQHGTYSLSFDGSATVTVFGGSISNINYSNGKTTATVTVATSGDTTLRLRFTGTNGGVKNVKLMRPTTFGGSTPHGENELFHRETMNVLKKFNFIRYMDYLGINSDRYTLSVEWNTRTTPGYYTQACAWPIVGPFAYQSGNYAYQGKGGSWEYLIMMANESNTDAWINIPHGASDDYILKVAQMFKYGSDGINPYTSTQSNPTYPPLNSNLKVYIEYSNEVWNNGFPQTAYNRNLANGEDSALLDYKGDGKGLDWHRVAYKTAMISNTFRSVFGDGDMMTRIRPLFEWQKGQGADGGNANNGTGSRGLLFLEEALPNGIDYYVWGGGGSGYFQGSETATIDTFWDTGEMDPELWLSNSQRNMQSMVAAFGLRRAVYEGGVSLGNQNGGSGSNALGDQIILDPRVKNEVVEHQIAFNTAGGGMFGNFVLGGDYRWGFMQRPSDINTYKLQGIDEIKGDPIGDITYGADVSQGTTTLVWGNQHALSNESGGGVYNWFNTSKSDQSKSLPENVWYSYDFNVETNGSYKVRVNYSNATNGSQLKLYSGSTDLGTETISGTGSTAWYTFNADNDRLYAIRVKAQSGSFNIETVEFVGNSNDYVCTLASSKISHEFDFHASSTTSLITTDDTFTVTDDADWLTTSVNGNEVTINVSANTSTSPRNATITINGCQTKTINISQIGFSCSLALSSSDENFENTGGSTNVTVTTNEASWTASSNQSWATTSISGDVLTINVAENTTPDSRIAEITVNDGCDSIVFQVNQLGTQTMGYRYIRFVITDTNDTYPDLERIKVNDLRVGQTNPDNSVTWVSVTGGLWDTGTSLNYVLPFIAEVDLGAGNFINPDQYEIYTWFGPQRTPRDFTIEGSNDDTNWDVLHTVTGFDYLTLTPEGSTRYVFPFNSLSVGDIANSYNSFKLYPNPASNKFFIEGDRLDKAEVLIYDLIGKLIFESKLRNGSLEVSTNNMNAGTYFIKVTSEFGSSVKKLIVE